MSNSELPERIDAYKLTDQGSRLEGVVSSVRLERLADAVLSQDAQFNAVLNFNRDTEQRRVVEGSISGNVEMECQRCLQPVAFHLDSRFALAVVHNDEMAKALPASFEPLLLMPDQPLLVAEVLEDELLLSLPMHAMHAEGECEIQTEFKPEGESESEQPEKENPFKVLESLKKH